VETPPVLSEWDMCAGREYSSAISEKYTIPLLGGVDVPISVGTDEVGSSRPNSISINTVDELQMRNNRGINTVDAQKRKQ